MNDETLDQELHALFAANAITVDPAGEAAEALLDDITSEPVMTGHVVETAAVSAPVLDGEVVELRSETPDRSRGRLLVAAVVGFIALISFGAWNVLTSSDAGPVVSDDGIDDGPVDDDPVDVQRTDVSLLPPGSIVGSEVPLVMVVHGEEGRLGEVEECIFKSTDSWDPRQPGSFATAYAFEHSSGFNVPVHIDTGFSKMSCAPDGSGSGGVSSALLPFTEAERVRVDSYSGSGLPSGQARILVEGFLSSDVTVIELVDPAPAEQTFVRLRGRFVIVAVLDEFPADEVALVEVTFVDGEKLTLDDVRIDPIASIQCDADCLPAKLQSLADEAEAAGVASAQAEALADGELTQAEYDEAVDAFMTCAASISSVQITLPGVFMEGTREADAAGKCHEVHLRFVELGRTWHNHAAMFGQGIPGEEEVIEGSIDSNVVEAAANWKFQAADLFSKGLDSVELVEFWDGYPYGEGEKDARIASYLREFAWIQADELNIEINSFTAFDQSPFFTPIVTVQSQDDPSKVAAFVMGLTENDDLTIGRLPERGTPIVRRDSQSITVAGMGSEGGPAAFAKGEELVVDTDPTEPSTTVLFPEGIDAATPITVVFPTPELPGAFVVFPDSEEPVDATEPVNGQTGREWPAQANREASNPGGINRAGGRGVGLVEATGELIEIDLAVGETLGTLTRIDIEARTLGPLQLNWDGTAVYFSELVEDFWFSCDSAGGAIRRVDLASGVNEVVAQGTEPRISPDGTRLAYLTSSQCLPDPTGGDFVLSIVDTVVVRDIETGREARWADEELQATVLAESNGTGVGGDLGEAALSGLQWLDGDSIAIGSFRLNADSLGVEGESFDIGAEGGSLHDVLGYAGEDDGFVIATPLGDEGTQLALATGDAYSVLGFVTAASFDSTFENLAVIEGNTLSIDGRSVELEVELSSFDW